MGERGGQGGVPPSQGEPVLPSPALMGVPGLVIALTASTVLKSLNCIRLESLIPQ